MKNAVHARPPPSEAELRETAEYTIAIPLPTPQIAAPCRKTSRLGRLRARANIRVRYAAHCSYAPRRRSRGHAVPQAHAPGYVTFTFYRRRPSPRCHKSATNAAAGHCSTVVFKVSAAASIIVCLSRITIGFQAATAGPHWFLC